jgi:hypothetical protein
MDRIQAEESGTAKKKSSGHCDKVVDPRDAFLSILVKFRKRMFLNLIPTWAKVSYGSLARCFVTWINFIYHFFT